MKTWSFLLPLFKPFQTQLLLGVAIALLAATASIMVLMLSGWFITAAAVAGYFASEGVAISFNFLLPAAEVRALAIVRTLAVYIERLYTHHTTLTLLVDLRCWLFSRLVPLMPGGLGYKRSADLLSLLTQDIDCLQALYLRVLLPALVALLCSVSVIILMFSYSVWLGGFVLFMLLMAMLFIPWLLLRIVWRQTATINQQQTDFNSAQIELLQGMAELSAFNMYSQFQHQQFQRSQQLLKTQQRSQQFIALATSIVMFLSQCAVFGVLWIGGFHVQQGNLTVALLMMLVFAVLAVFEFILPLSGMIQAVVNSQLSAQRMQQINQLPATIPEPDTPLNLPEKGGIRIDNLSFRYAQQSEWVFKSLNLNISVGSKIAIIGESGTGKSTLLHLLTHLFQPQQGRIQYSGLDYSKLNSHQLRQRFALLSQQNSLFSATLRENLCLAKPDASEQQLQQAIQQAGLTHFVKTLTKGLDTWLGENGVSVSGGEARRIALACVYLKDAPIILLDEPTEGLDKKTEQEILLRLEQICQNKTLILVTHRPACLHLVNQVYQLNQGELQKV